MSEQSEIKKATMIAVDFDWMKTMMAHPLYRSVPIKDIVESALEIPTTHNQVRIELMMIALEDSGYDLSHLSMHDKIVGLLSILDLIDLKLQSIGITDVGLVFKAWVDPTTMILITANKKFDW